MKYFLLILKNVGRNPLRTLLTALGTMMLVFVVTLVWSILSFLDDVTAEKSGDMKVDCDGAVDKAQPDAFFLCQDVKRRRRPKTRRRATAGFG